jgi:glycerophosphoryl diester phosphodiesterase
MHRGFRALVVLALLAAIPTFAPAQQDRDEKQRKDLTIQLGPRPFYLVDNMDAGPLKQKLQSCSEGPFYKTDFSIGHRGAALQFPEHTKQSYMAAAREGAGIIECDASVTQDGEFVCRHDQCDLHATTDILQRPELASRCAKDASGNPVCCTSQFTLAEVKGLCGKMEGITPPSFRPTLYATCGTIMSHKDSIDLMKKLDRKFTPELKQIRFVPSGFTYDMLRQKLIDEYKEAAVDPHDVFPQSFFLEDILYWIHHDPAFGRQAVYLDDRVDTPAGYDQAKTLASMQALYQQGVRIIAPAFWALLTVENGKIVPSEYAKNAKLAGLDIITWSIERSGPIATLPAGEYYYQSIRSAVNNDGDIMTVLDVLAKQVGVRGVFADWPATVTYYANCMNPRHEAHDGGNDR